MNTGILESCSYFWGVICSTVDILQNSIRQEELLASWACLPLVYHGEPGDLPHRHLLSKNNMGASYQAQGHTFLLKNQLIYKQKSPSLNLEADDKST